MPTKTPILLLKTKSTPQDGYDDFFTANNYTPTFIPVLEHRFHGANLARVREFFASGAFDATSTDKDTDHVDSGRSIVGHGEGKKYGGMIFTSQRAVEAFVKMIEEGFPSSSIPKHMPLYTVGPATARSLSSLRDRYLPTATIHGAEAGNGEKLAHYILEHYNSLYASPETQSQNQTGTRTEGVKQNPKPGLLFLVGEQRRDIIPRTLMDPTLSKSQRVDVDEVVVYETGEMGSFEGDFRDAVGRSSDAGSLWVVVFSPSGCEGMLRVLGLGPFDTGTGGGAGGKRRVFVATIGPTTRDHLKEKFGFEADVCAERPSPEGVGEGIRRFMDDLKE